MRVRLSAYRRKAGAVWLALATVLALSGGATAWGQPAAPSAAPASAPGVARSPLSLSEDAERIELWRKAIVKTPLPGKGCFKAAYPALAWQQTPCKAPPPYPMAPRLASVGGGGAEVSAQAPVNQIIESATGSFDTVAGVVSEEGQIAGAGPNVQNAYTLQLNINFFNSPACAAPCQGWEQFVYWNDGASGSVFIQYWLVGFGPTLTHPCPPGGWTPSGASCFRDDSAGAVGVAQKPITTLQDLTVTGTATAAGDSIAVSFGPLVLAVTGDNFVHAASGWQVAEFNVFGAGTNPATGAPSQADFNPGALIVPRITLAYNGGQPPLCDQQSFTNETNNLAIGPGAPAPQAGSALTFEESSGGGLAQPFCPAVAPPPPPPAHLLAVFRCNMATPSLAAAYGVGILTTHPQFCSKSGPAVAPTAVPANVAEDLGALPALGGVHAFRCVQLAQNLGGAYGIGQITTDPQFCWHGGGPQPPQAVPPLIATLTPLRTPGGLAVYRCNLFASLPGQYGIGTLTTHPQFCSNSSNPPPPGPGSVSSAVASDTGWRTP